MDCTTSQVGSGMVKYQFRKQFFQDYIQTPSYIPYYFIFDSHIKGQSIKAIYAYFPFDFGEKKHNSGRVGQFQGFTKSIILLNQPWLINNLQSNETLKNVTNGNPCATVRRIL